MRTQTALVIFFNQFSKFILLTKGGFLFDLLCNSYFFAFKFLSSSSLINHNSLCYLGDSDKGSNKATKFKKESDKESSKMKPLESSYFVKRTSKFKYNFNLNAIVFNQRLSFDLNPQLHIEDYRMSIHLNAHSLKFCFDSNFADPISVKEARLPSIIFRCDLIERWIQLDKDNKV